MSFRTGIRTWGRLVLASDITSTEHWLNVWCVWHTYLETLQSSSDWLNYTWFPGDVCIAFFNVPTGNKDSMAPNPLTKEESHRVTTVMTNACQDQINTDFSKLCEIFKVCGIESLKYVREFHTPVYNCGDISTHRNMTRNETNCDWLFYMLVKRGRALANESYHRFQTFSHQSEVEVDRYGFFSGRCWYLEIKWPI